MKLCSCLKVEEFVSALEVACRAHCNTLVGSGLHGVGHITVVVNFTVSTKSDFAVFLETDFHSYHNFARGELFRNSIFCEEGIQPKYCEIENI